MAAAVVAVVPRARRETEMTEMKVPSMVWGLVKRYRAMKKREVVARVGGEEWWMAVSVGTALSRGRSSGEGCVRLTEVAAARKDGLGRGNVDGEGSAQRHGKKIIGLLCEEGMVWGGEGGGTSMTR